MSQEHMFIRPERPLDPAQVLADLNSALSSDDDEVIDGAVLAAFQVGLRSEFAAVFVRLLALPHHHKHEDLVHGLQELKDPSAVEAIYRAASVRHEYLDYDEFFGLARKCTWALADIGTSDAKEKLKLLSAHENPAIAGYAKKRLDKWEEEDGRKGTRA